MKKDKIQELREKRRFWLNYLLKNVSQAEIAAKYEEGCEPSYISNLSKGKKPISEKVVRRLECASGKPEGWFDRNIGNVFSSNNDQDFIDRHVIRKQIEFAPNAINKNTEPGPDIRGLTPLVSWVIAGKWCEINDSYTCRDAEDWLPCPVSHGPNTYCLRVKGDSMTNFIPGQKSYPEGVIIFVDPDRPITNGCRVVAKLPNCEEATFKEYREDNGKRYLKPLNHQYDILEIDDEIRICGVVIFAGSPE